MYHVSDKTCNVSHNNFKIILMTSMSYKLYVLHKNKITINSVYSHLVGFEDVLHKNNVNQKIIVSIRYMVQYLF